MGMLPHRGLKEGSRSLGRDRLAVASVRQWAVAMMTSVIFCASSGEMAKTNTRA